MKKIELTRKPLLEISLSVSFPTILLIEKELPISFQEKIRSKLPIFKDGMSSSNEISIGIDGLPQSFSQRKFRNYLFLSEDSKVKVLLSSSALTITSLCLTDLLGFAEYCTFVINSFKEAYQINYFQKLAIRTLYAFSPKDYDSLAEFNWAKIIKEEYISFLRIENNVNAFTLQLVNYDDDTKITSKKNIGLGKIQNDKDTSMILDFNYFYLTKIELSEVNKIILGICKKCAEDYKAIVTEDAASL